MSHIAAVKKDMIILEKSEFSTLLAENEVSEAVHFEHHGSLVFTSLTQIQERKK